MRGFKFFDEGCDVASDWLIVHVGLVGGEEALDYLSGSVGSRLTAIAKLSWLNLIMNDVTLNN